MKYDEITVTKQETEFVAKHKDYDVIGVGGNEFEAVLELSKALGALMFSRDIKAQKEHELLGLYRLQQEFQEKYNTEERLIQKMRCLDELREIKEELDALEKEIEEMK